MTYFNYLIRWNNSFSETYLSSMISLNWDLAVQSTLSEILYRSRIDNSTVYEIF